MPLTLNNTNTLTADTIIVGGTELSQIYATKSEIGNNAQIVTNTDDIAVLNTKQLQNFNNINAINTDLTNKYQTNSQLSSNFYNKTEIDTTFTNYYTSSQIDTNLSTNYQNNTLLATNFYNKSEVDTLIAGAGGGGGYTDTEIDNLLDLRVPVSDFTDRFKTNPIIDCSAPTIIHSGLTLNNETINISPTTGLLFSNQFGGGDKIVSVFKNATNYITLQGNKIIANDTSDDSLTNLDLNPSSSVSVNDLNIGGIATFNNNQVFNNDIITVKQTGLTLNRNSGDSNYSLRIADLQGIFEFRNRNFRCMNPTIPTNGTEMVIQDANDLRVKIGSTNNARVGIGTNNSASYFLTVGGVSNFNQARVATDLEVVQNINLTGDLNFNGTTANVNDASNGLTFYKDTTDASNVVTIKNAQGYIRFNSFNINAYNTSNDSSSLLLLNTANGNGVYCLSLGIGAIQGANKLNVSGGNSNFGGTASFQNTSTFNSDINVNNSGRIFQRADANSSLNVISTNEINFSLQSNRADDPTTGTIALQLNDTNGITINRAVTNNLTFNSIGRITAEADLDVWGELFFQHSSSIKETLNGSDYDLDIRNGDTDRAINFIIGTIGSTPEIQLTEGKVNLLGNLEITHTDVSGSQRVLINNPDTDGFIRLSNNNLSRLDATTTGVDVYGDLSYTGSLIPSSDKRLKKDIKELNSKKAVELVKYIKPKTYHFVDGRMQGKSCCGLIANDFMETKKMPDEWLNLVKEGADGYLKFDYTITTPILWSALQATINEVDKLKKEVNKLKGKGKGNRSDSN